MRFIVAAPSTDGHLNPIISIGKLLVGQRHDVLVVTGDNRREKVEAAGLTFASVAAEAGEQAFDMAAVLPKLRDLSGVARTVVGACELYFRLVAPLHESLLRIDDEFRADAVFSSVAFAGTLPYFSEHVGSRPTIIQCCFSSLMSSRDDGAPYGYGLPPAEREEDRNKYETIRRRHETDFTRPILDCIGDGLASLGRSPLSTRSMDFFLSHSNVFAEFTVPSFEYPRQSSVKPVRFVGSLFTPSPQLPDPDWLPDLDGRRKVVLVTQGTLANYSLDDLVAPTLRALEHEDDLLVIVTTGGAPRELLSLPLPTNARLETYLPFERILPKVDVLVTNGGFGTVNLALAHGIPCVVAGMSEDKAETAARVSWVGAGLYLRTSTPDVSAVRNAVRTLLTDRSYARRAAELADEYARYDAAVAVTEIAKTSRRLRSDGDSISPAR